MNVKKQIWLVLLAVLSCIGLLIGCSFDKSSIKSNLEPSKPTVQEIQKSGLTPEKKVEASIDAMTTEEKVGQLFIVGVHGTAMNDDIRFMLTEYKYGGGNEVLRDALASLVDFIEVICKNKPYRDDNVAEGDAIELLRKYINLLMLKASTVYNKNR